MRHLIFELSHFEYPEFLKVGLQIIPRKEMQGFVRLNGEGIFLNFRTLSKGSIPV